MTTILLLLILGVLLALLVAVAAVYGLVQSTAELVGDQSMALLDLWVLGAETQALTLAVDDEMAP